LDFLHKGPIFRSGSATPAAIITASPLAPHTIHLRQSPPHGASPTLSPLKRRAFVLFTAAFSLVIVLALEITLRLVHYGPDLSLFVHLRADGRQFTIMNPAVKNRFFNRIDFNPSTSPDLFIIPKPAGTYRIVCLGGSTTVGYPFGYLGAFPTFLRTRLQTQFPGRSIEVINLGMTATNSFTVCDFMRDRGECQPDLILVYDGHNEFYGALGIASKESVARARWVTKLYLRLLHWKSFLLLRDLYTLTSRALSPRAAPDSGGTMMEQLARGQLVPFAGEEYREALETFRANVAEMTETAAALNAPLLLGSQVSNLRDLPPFVSTPSPSLTAGQQARCDSLFEAAAACRRDGDNAGALSLFAAAQRIDSSRADVFYGIAKTLDVLGQFSRAYRAYVRARDLDQLRFRASTDFNAALAGAADGKKVFFVDMEEAFRKESPDSLIGNTLLLEHLHPNAHGSFLLAKAYADVMAKNGLLASPEEWQRSSISDSALWALRLITPLDSLIARRETAILTSGWPFRNSYPTVPPVDPQDTVGLIVEKVARGVWNSATAHEAAARFHALHKDFSAAAREMRAVAGLDALDIDAHRRWAQFALEAGRPGEEREALIRAFQILPEAELAKSLGDAFLAASDYPSSIRWYRTAIGLPCTPTEQAEAHFALGLVFLHNGNPGDAEAELRASLSLNPQRRDAAALLNRLAGLSGPTGRPAR